MKPITSKFEFNNFGIKNRASCPVDPVTIARIIVDTIHSDEKMWDLFKSHIKKVIFGHSNRDNTVMKLLKLQLLSLSLLNKVDKKKLILAALLQMSLGIFDLIGVLLIGTIGVLASSYLSHQQIPSRLSFAFEFFGVNSYESQTILIAISVAALFFFISKSFFSLYVSRRIFLFLAQRQANVANQMYSLILRSDFNWFKSKSRSEIIDVLDRGVGAAIVNSLGQTILVFSELSMILMFLLVLIFISPIMCCSFIVYLGFIAIGLNYLIGSKVSHFAKTLLANSLEGKVVISDSLKLFREIVIYRKSDEISVKMKEIYNRQANAFAEETWIQQIPKFALELALILGAFLIITVGYFYYGGADLLANLVLYMAGASRIFPGILRAQASILSMRSFSPLNAEFHELRSEVSNAREIKPLADPINLLSECNSTITFANVAYKYSENASFSLSDISIDIPANTRIAVVGASGAGKSTFCELLLGLLVPTSGFISIGTFNNIEWIDRNRGKIAYVPQEPVLISGTLIQNICLNFDNLPPNEDRLLKIINSLHLDSFISTLPNGLNTILADSDSVMSGGQKQRIALARALYQEPKIIVLDEPTSSLDSTTELAITEFLSESKRDFTIIMIAHRLNTVRNFDQILYLEDGHIAAVGNFDDLRLQNNNFDQMAKNMGI